MVFSTGYKWLVTTKPQRRQKSNEKWDVPMLFVQKIECTILDLFMAENSKIGTANNFQVKL